MIMRTLAALAVTLGCTGCVGTGTAPVQEGSAFVVGPSARVSSGTLQVFTETTPEIDGDSMERWLHQPYRIYDLQGELVRTVSNEREEPVFVSLPPGRYEVYVPSSKLKVIVDVQDRRVTQVRAPELARTDVKTAATALPPFQGL